MSFNNLINVLKKHGIISEKNKLTKKYQKKLNLNPILLQKIVEHTAFLQYDAKINERIYCILQNITEQPRCATCNKPLKMRTTGKVRYTFAKYCNGGCVGKNKNIKEKREQTNLEKYGVENPFQSEKIKEKIKQTNMEKYGVENPSQSEKIKEKIKQTNLEKYGVKNPTQSKIIREKVKQTNMEKYGVEYPIHSRKIKEKIKQTNLEKYGVENPFQSEKIKEKIKQTNLKKYGVEYPMQAPEIKSKFKQTNLKKYGVEFCIQKHFSNKTLELLDNKEWLMEQHHIKQKPIAQIAKELNISSSATTNHFKKHNIEIKNFFFSNTEKEILDFLYSIIPNTEVLTNSRNIIFPYELDIYIPEYALAIEYNGLFWHSEAGGKSYEYHLKKTDMCEEKGIRLIHIFEDEWRDQQQKCKETLQHLLGKSPRGVYARHTTIREIEWKEAKEFLNRYHLLGAGTPGNYRIGAFDKDDNLIGVMVFGHKNNEGNDNFIELKRFVTNKKNNPGLGSKMFKYAVNEKGYNEVIAFVDRRWFTGLVKSHIGFEKVGITKPALWWTDFNKRYHRRFITKKQLLKMGCDISISKRKILESMGYYRIWDCGKVKLKWSKN